VRVRCPCNGKLPPKWQPAPEVELQSINLPRCVACVARCIKPPSSFLRRSNALLLPPAFQRPPPSSFLRRSNALPPPLYLSLFVPICPYLSTISTIIPIFAPSISPFLLPLSSSLFLRNPFAIPSYHSPTFKHKKSPDFSELNYRTSED